MSVCCESILQASPTEKLLFNSQSTRGATHRQPPCIILLGRQCRGPDDREKVVKASSCVEIAVVRRSACIMDVHQDIISISVNTREVLS